MDQDRQIRFLIPPFFLFASLLWGAHLGHLDISRVLKFENAKEILGVLAATAVAVIPVGFLVSAISVLLLRAFARACGQLTYDLGDRLQVGPTYEPILASHLPGFTQERACSSGS